MTVRPERPGRVTVLGDRGATLHELVLAQAARSPARVAVRDDRGAVTYAELAAGIVAASGRLRELGIGPGAYVGVVASRSRFTAMAMLAVTAAGAAYVPLEPTSPVVRLRAVVDAARIGVVLVPDSDDTGEVAALDDVTSLARTSWAPDRPEPTGVVDAVSAEEPAYALFTSGSTGTPKGVVVPHRAVVNLLAHMAVEPGLAPGETMLGVTTPAFDLSVPDLFLPLVVGATSVLVPREAAVDGRALAGWFDRFAPHLAEATPSTWRLLLAAGWPGSARTSIVCGGEAFEAALVRELAHRVGAVWNFYGPTETTVWSLAGRLSATTTDPVPLGSPIRNTTCRVVDDAGRAVGAGDVGELVIGGDGVALGYLGRDDLTAAVFVADPSAAGARAFRTGDTVRIGPAGDLSFVGRRDAQVKVSGHRVELGDVEAALRQCPGVERAVVVLDEGLLAAFVVGATDAAGVRRDAARLLPEYMVPASVTALDALPLTPNGKIDRRALAEARRTAAPAAPTVGTLHPQGAEPVPVPPVTAEVVDIWAEVLATPVAPSDEFFALGGSSLAATRICTRVAERLGVELRVVDLFSHPTPSGIADLVVAALLLDITPQDTVRGQVGGD